MTTPAQKKKRGFTLIELLIVIAIIGILMGLMFPAVSSAMDAARKAQAKNTATQIATAVIAYETEYGRLPVPSGTSADVTSQNVGSSFLAVLMGTNGNNISNSRRIVFLEVPNAKTNSGVARNGLDGGVGSGNYRDPWGGVYQVALDGNYDNSITPAVGSSGPTAGNLRKRVAVWTTNSDAKRRVGSWE